MSLSHFAPCRRALPRAARSPVSLLALLSLSVALAAALAAVLPSPALAAPSFQAGDPQSPHSAPAAEAAGRFRVRVPLIYGGPAAITGASYTAVPVPPPPSDRPADAHADLNLSLRGYTKTSASLTLIGYGGDTDAGAPQLPGIFSDHRTPAFTSAHRVYEWNWDCGPDGCRGNPIANPGVTLLGMQVRKGELLAAPTRYAEIYGGGYVALVLYADEQRITLKYTRDDNVVGGYTAHLENLDVDRNLLNLYRQTDAAGRTQLPAVSNGQPLGMASGSEVLVAIRDCGAFLDPRSRKDWWQGR